MIAASSIVAALLVAVTPSLHQRTVAAARQFGGPYSILEDYRPTAMGGPLVDIEGGRVAMVGDALTEGVWINLSGETVYLFIEEVGAYELVPMEAVGVDLPDDGFDPEAAPLKTCTVSCDDGYYACCKYGSPPTCKCYLPADLPNNCDAGGAGAASCSIAQGKLNEPGAEVPE